MALKFYSYFKTYFAVLSTIKYTLIYELRMCEYSTTYTYNRRLDVDIRAIMPIYTVSTFKQQQNNYLLMLRVLTISICLFLSECDVSCDGGTLSVILRFVQ